jgi:hypothetical protein
MSVTSEIKLITHVNPLKHSGSYMYQLIKHSVTLHFAQRVYLWVLYNYENKQRSAYFLNSINQSSFVMEKHCVFFEVGTEILNIF